MTVDGSLPAAWFPPYPWKGRLYEKPVNRLPRYDCRCRASAFVQQIFSYVPRHPYGGGAVAPCPGE